MLKLNHLTFANNLTEYIIAFDDIFVNTAIKILSFFYISMLIFEKKSTIMFVAIFNGTISGFKCRKNLPI